MSENKSLVEITEEEGCEHIKPVIEMIIKHNLEVSSDDYGVSQIWCPICGKGVTWSKENR